MPFGWNPRVYWKISAAGVSQIRVPDKNVSKL